MQEYRPDPNRILDAVRTAQTKNAGGRLYIFLGMCPGVGKTYSMLENAHKELEESGTDVVVGVAATHGREETAALLKGLPQVPQKKIRYKGKEFEELDLEAVLKRRPQIAVIDELAHTNIPGSRHEKRWQDVEELLGNGIDVYTTVNIQHVESRREDVALITGITVQETVPDAVFERANQIKLIDLPPEQLLERLKEGKVYLPQNVAAAAENFFRPDKLTALRELSLRFAGDVVGSELDALNACTTSRGAKEKVLVLIYPDPETKKIIRAARKAVFATDGELYGLLMDRNGMLPEKEKESLLANAELLGHMNGEVITSIDTDRFTAIKDVITKYGITRVMLRRGQNSLLLDLFGGGSLVTRLLKETQADVVLMRHTDLLGVRSSLAFWRTIYLETNPSRYYRIFLLLAAVTLFNVGLAHYSGYLAVGFVYLLLVLFVGMFSSLGPIAFCAVGSALAWNFFFIPPVFTFKINRMDDLVMTVAYLLTATVTSVLTHRIISSRRLLRQREERNEVLLKTARVLAQTLENPHKTFLEVAALLKRILPGELAFVYQTGPGRFETANSHPMGYAWTDTEKEKSVGLWSMKNRTDAGWSTATLSSSEALYLPLAGGGESVGFLSYLPHDYEQKLSVEDRTLLSSVAAQVAGYLVREKLKTRSEELKRMEETQKIYALVLNTVSHELKTPLTVINGAISVLKRSGGNSTESMEDLQNATQSLTHEINNILDISKISAGPEIKKEWNDLQDVVYSAVGKLKQYAAGHALETSFQPDLPFVRINFALVESALSNLIVNAVNYTPRASRIWVKAYAQDNKVILETADDGPGLDAQERSLIFNKFYRAKNASACKSGSGLGLFIAKSVAELHGGRILAEENKPRGLRVILEFPLEKQPELEEKSV